MQISSAAILLFGKNPQLYFPRARVRFIRYEGTEERVGTQMNVIKDVIFEGNILKMITDAVAYPDTQIKEKTYLGEDGLFVTEEEYQKHEDKTDHIRDISDTAHVCVDGTYDLQRAWRSDAAAYHEVFPWK